jgi:hypothetical protein
MAAARVSDLHPQTQSEQVIVTGLIQELRAILDTHPANLTPHANGTSGMSVHQGVPEFVYVMCLWVYVCVGDVFVGVCLCGCVSVAVQRACVSASLL